MAKTWERFEPAAKSAQAYIGQLREVRRMGRDLNDYYLQNDLGDAGADPTPAYVQVDANGNIRGMSMTPADFVQILVLVQEVEKLLTNQVPAPNNYVYTIDRTVKL